MRITDRTLGVLLILAAGVIAFYWWSYFTAGHVRTIDALWYTAFEDSFPVADGWMALCCAIAGVGFILKRAWAPLFGLMAASALVYLACMDITFDVQNGMYALAATNDAMKFEIFINVTTVLLALLALIVSWRRAVTVS